MIAPVPPQEEIPEDAVHATSDVDADVDDDEDVEGEDVGANPSAAGTNTHLSSTLNQLHAHFASPRSNQHLARYCRQKEEEEEKAKEEKGRCCGRTE